VTHSAADSSASASPDVPDAADATAPSVSFDETGSPDVSVSDTESGALPAHLEAEVERRVAARTAELAAREEAVRHREELFRRLTENSADMVQIVGADTRIVYTGPSVLRLLGYHPDEIAGTSAMDYLHPDDVPPTVARFGQMLEMPGRPVHVEYRVWDKGRGEWRWFEANAMTLSPTSADEGIVVNARDITARKEAAEALRRSEERFRAMIENAHDGIAILQPDGRTRYQSPSMERLVGHAPGDTEGRPLFDFVHPADAPRVRDTLEAIARFPGSTGAVEYRYLHADGGWRILEAFGRTLLPASADEGIVANVRDVTGRRQAEEALRAAKAEAERANDAKSEFLSRMSHELRTPLNSILGFAQILEGVEMEARDKRAVRHILTAGEHLLGLINEVLDIARIEAGSQALSLEPVDLDAVIDEALGLVRPLAAARGIHVEPPATPAAGLVRADRQRLTQVLLNLLSNAVKYNRPEGRVAIGAVAVDARGGPPRVRVWVEDTGTGVPAARRDELFTPFARLGAEMRGIDGTGLGLALSRRLAEAMGGRLWLADSTAEGSTFCVELEAAGEGDETVPPGEGDAAVEGAAPVPAATLLYVEDNLANLSLVEQLLAYRPGWRLVPALQGQLGLELAREHAPDVVLLDLHLPDVPGEQVLRQLRADPRTARLPVVVVTADATPRTMARLRAAGADAYLTKPLRVDAFLTAVDAALARRRDA
jgi:PAS domain S-box-containing protein